MSAMTVGELREKLEGAQDDAEVLLADPESGIVGKPLRAAIVTDYHGPPVVLSTVEPEKESHGS